MSDFDFYIVACTMFAPFVASLLFWGLRCVPRRGWPANPRLAWGAGLLLFAFAEPTIAVQVCRASFEDRFLFMGAAILAATVAVGLLLSAIFELQQRELDAEREQRDDRPPD
jgi:hypothetical protein